MRRVFSGIQPSGIPHIGNYLGALKNWIALQNTESALPPIYCIVDLHALTTLSGHPQQLRQLTIESTASLLACGLDPKKSIIFKQSSIHHHTQLAWILSCITSSGVLGRMNQWKSRQKTHNSTLGLFSYPMLMCADILLYRSTDVPVGDDQIQHLELARNTAEIFNRTYETDFMKIAELILPSESGACRVMSLREPLEKMSKSNQSEYSRINLSDMPSVVKSKILRAVTDNESRVSFEPDTRPGVSNLVSIYGSYSDKTIEMVCQEFEGKSTHEFKIALHDLLIEKLYAYQTEYQRIMEDKGYILNVLEQGRKQALEIADENMKQILEMTGLSYN
ncbi:putative Tryptophanyl-tRNA synthetase [Oopsacas minuta]|uniref:tryptophan--tRNA ligase n=1 Tax=Oopsacas minuta TaxID=111878 RepID=A0AAV7KI72_9METZ|nr:putative Tryptophanyl-tRNA synthetase [Oopsacas minuta]